MRLTLFAGLVMYSVVVSQALTYLVAMTGAQRALSAPAYIEVRHGINAIMNRRVPVIYGSAAIAMLVLFVLAWRAGEFLVLGAAIIALVCLVADLALAARLNLPINNAVDSWSPEHYPADWVSYREKWFAILAYREAVLLAGFASLLFGAVFRR
jgi:hypothetical protein